MKKINTALFCLFVLLFCSCDVLNKAPLDEIADDSFLVGRNTGEILRKRSI